MLRDPYRCLFRSDLPCQRQCSIPRLSSLEKARNIMLLSLVSFSYTVFAQVVLSTYLVLWYVIFLKLVDVARQHHMVAILSSSAQGRLRPCPSSISDVLSCSCRCFCSVHGNLEDEQQCLNQIQSRLSARWIVIKGWEHLGLSSASFKQCYHKRLATIQPQSKRKF